MVKTKSMERKLRQFDLRRLGSSTKPTANPLAMDNRPVLDAGEISAEVELGFHIVAWSSQRPTHEAVSLQHPHGKWETYSKIGIAVQNEYLVFGLHGHPTAVTGLELTMGGSTTNPRRCRVQYAHIHQGPWKDAWGFAVDSKSSLTYHGKHEYGRLARCLREVVLDFAGNADVAWALLDTNSNGQLNKEEFEAACNRLQKLCPNHAISHVEPNRIFRDLDVDHEGYIKLEWLFSSTVRLPVATFWRLLILDTWGSPCSVVLNFPLRLFSTETAKATAQTFGHRARTEQSKFMEEMVSAWRPEVMHMSQEQRLIRRMAHEYEVSTEEVEEVYKEFKKFDQDRSETITRPEFEELIKQLHGVHEKSELPKSRLDFFWHQADEDGDGCIDFEEFLVWYSKKSPLTRAAREKKQQKALVEDPRQAAWMVHAWNA